MHVNDCTDCGHRIPTVHQDDTNECPMCETMTTRQLVGVLENHGMSARVDGGVVITFELYSDGTSQEKRFEISTTTVQELRDWLQY